MIYDKFKDFKFIIENDFDEWNYIKKRIDIDQKEELYSLLILPTYDCNFSCWYCVQRHTNSTMSEDVAEKTKKHIELYLKKIK